MFLMRTIHVRPHQTTKPTATSLFTIYLESICMFKTAYILLFYRFLSVFAMMRDNPIFDKDNVSTKWSKMNNQHSAQKWFHWIGWHENILCEQTEKSHGKICHASVILDKSVGVRWFESHTKTKRQMPSIWSTCFVKW